nr:glycine betaine ABC transporter substrate-binding protein [Pseudomonas sp. A-RE-23]
MTEKLFYEPNLPADGRLSNTYFMGRRSKTQQPRGGFEHHKTVERRKAPPKLFHYKKLSKGRELVVCSARRIMAIWQPDRRIRPSMSAMTSLDLPLFHYLSFIVISGETQMRLMHTFKVLMGGLALSLLQVLPVSAEQAPIRIGWINWADAEITAKLAAKAIEDVTGHPVKLVMADLGIQFQALANKSVDFIPMVWLPGAHKTFWDKYSSQVEDLGTVYDGKIGWAIPDSVPASEVSSIEDLNKPGIAAKFGNRILSAGAGNGQYKLSEKAIAEYGLKDYKLVASSEAGMLSELARDQSRDKWSIINAWNPHWMFAKWKLRYLVDSKNIFGGTEHIHVVSRLGFKADEPKIATFLEHYTLPLNDLETMQMQAKDSSVDEVVNAYYLKNRTRFAAMFQ